MNYGPIQRFFLILGLVFASFCGYSQSRYLEFEVDKYGFGRIPVGSMAEYKFKFRNVGNEPVKLTRVESNCGSCMRLLYSQSWIAPGAEGIIGMRLNTKEERMYDEVIYVSHDKSDKKLKLRIKAWVD